jgi:putative oxidoreductase
MKKFLYPNHSNSKIVSWVSLLLRIVFGLSMLSAHGWRKLLKAVADEPIRFADPIGVGEPMSLYLTVFAEVLCSALLVLGFFTRGVLVPLVITMLVAIFIIHFSDPFAKQELAIIYTTVYVAIFVLGPGKFSLDHLLFGKK